VENRKNALQLNGFDSASVPPRLLIRRMAATVTRLFCDPLRHFSGKHRVLSIIEAAGWPIWPLILCSVIALAIIGERLWSLRQNVVLPKNLLVHAIQAYRQNGVTPQLLSQLAASAPLGQILAAGLHNEKHSPAVMKEAIEEAGYVVAIELERFLTSLGTIAAIAPLLGLFGTVIGMIEIFGSQGPQGTNPLALAHGISIALYNTAFGLVVAVPSMVFYRYFRARVDALLVDMQIQAVKLVEIVHGERDA
jgi:biopolymer transport protein ExbB